MNGQGAAAEKNFRRAEVEAVAARGSGSPLAASWRAGRGVAAVLLVVYAGVPRVQPGRPRAPLQVRPHRRPRQCAAVDAARSRRSSTASAARSILTADLDRYRRRLLDSPWVADVALRRVLPSTVESSIAERTPMGCRRAGQPALPRRSHAASIIDEFGPHYREFDLPIVDGLVRAPTTGSRRSTRRAPSSPRGCSTRSAPRRISRQRSRRWTSRTSHDVGRAARRRHRAAASRRRRASSSGCRRTWSWRRRCASGCRHRLRRPAVRRPGVRAGRRGQTRKKPVEK